MAYAIDICHKEAADKGAAQQRVADTSSQRASSCTSAGTCDLSRNPFSGAGSATMDDSCPIGADGRRQHTYDYKEGGCRQVRNVEVSANLGWANPSTGSAMVMRRG